MKVLITGSAGFIGFNLYTHLRLAGHEVVGIDNFSNSIQRYGIWDMDVTGPDIVKLIETGKFDVVIHLAAMGSIQRCKANQLACYKQNVRGFQNVLEALMNTKTLLLYASSSSVYSEALEGDPTRDELDLVSPDSSPSLYGSTKVLNEMLGLMVNEHMGMKTIGLRFFNVFGPGQRWDVEYPAFVPTVIHKLHKKETINLYNYGENKRDFTPVEYAVRVIERLMHKAPSFGESVLNICWGQPIRCLDVLAMLEKETGLEAKVSMLPARAGEIQSVEGSRYLLSQLQTERPSFSDCLSEAVKYYRGNV